MRPKTMYVAVKGLFFENNKLLLIRKRNPDFWDIPGGRIEFGESIEKALKRELSEELPNIKHVSIGDLIGVRKKEVPLEDGNELFLVYYKVEADLPTQLELSDEHNDSKWFDKDEVDVLPSPLNRVYGDLFAKLLARQSSS